MDARPGGKILIDQLEIQGVERIYCVPGESYLAALDALYNHPTITTVVCRQEGGAAMMAEAEAKLTGRPGIAFVTRGPGATNAAAGVHIAFQDSTPMLLLIGQVGRDASDREAFQEVEFRQMFAPLAKWTAQIERAERIPEYISRAFHVAMSGRPGPVVLALPEDMLVEEASVADAAPALKVGAQFGPGDLAEIAEMLEHAQRPLLLLGGGGWTGQASADIQSFAEHYDLPVACVFRCQDYFDNHHPNYIGDVGIGINPKLAERVREADLVIAIGPRLGEMTTSGYTLLDVPDPKQKLIHIHASAGELGRVYRPALAVNAASPAAASALASLKAKRSEPWSKWREAGRNDYLANIEPQETPGDVKMEKIVRWLSETLPRNAIIANGAGNYAGWLARYYQYSPYRTQLGPTSGSMGYGLPGAIAAKLVYPERTVVAFAGDGCFLMTSQELATAVQYRLAIVIIVCNNAMYGTIRMHQERDYPGRVSATALHNPDFAAMAQSFGAQGETVVRTEDFAAAFERAQASEGPALIELKIDPEAITHRTTLSAIRSSG